MEEITEDAILSALYLFYFAAVVEIMEDAVTMADSEMIVSL